MIPLTYRNERKLTASTPVVKHNHGPRLPLQPHLEIVTARDVIHQVLEQPLGLALLPPLYACDPLVVDEEGLLAGHGVDADKRVEGLDGVLAAQAAVVAREVADALGGVYRLEAIEHLSEAGGEAPESGLLVFGGARGWGGGTNL